MDANTPRLLIRSEVEARARLCTSSVYRLMRKGLFPLPVRVGERAVRWREDEINAWNASRPYARGEAERAAG